MQLALISHESDTERLLSALRGNGWVDSRWLYRHLNVMVHSRVADLRRKGYEVECRRTNREFGPSGYQYRLKESVEAIEGRLMEEGRMMRPDA